MVRVGLSAAEALSAPLASVECFRTCCTIPNDTSSVQHLARRYSQLGIRDDAKLRMHKIVRQNESIELFLIRNFHEILECTGETAALKPNYACPGEEILRWRWISLALPVDLILATLGGCRAERVRILDSSLRVLEPTAHLHFHATAGIPFWEIWKGFGKEADFRQIQDFPCGFSGVSEWKSWLRRAFVASRTLEAWISGGIKAVCVLITRWPQIDLALRDLRSGCLSENSHVTESSLTGFLRLPDSYVGLGKEVSKSNKIRRKSKLGTAIELDRRCIRHMQSNSSSTVADKRLVEFREIWVQMTRIRVMLYRHLVHDPAQAGLDEFAQRFSRLDSYLGSGNSIQREVNAAAKPDKGLHIKTLELRKAPGGISKLREMHESSLTQHRKRNRQASRTIQSRYGIRQAHPKLTWTLHFIRDSYPNRDLTGRIRGHYATAQNLASAFRSCPELLKSIRGLDVASNELSGPLWTVVAPLQSVRKETVRISSEHPGISPLKVTVHAGEDFRSLLSGLRAIHEPFWWKLMKRGDRIGHALALGWEPRDWCARNPEILQPRLERMFDIAWVLDFATSRRIAGITSMAIETLRSDLQKHLQRLGGVNSHYDVDEFVAVARDLGTSELWTDIDGPHWKHCKLEGKYRGLLKAILSRFDKPDHRPDDLIDVRTNGECGLLESLRDELAELLAQWRTPIEINPSSNLLIGDLPYPLAQPLFHLDPFDRKEKRGLVLTLSADDPACFATSLADEYAYAWAGMVVGKGESPAYAQEWLERAARAARRAAF